MKRIQRNHVKVGTGIRVKWEVNSIEFIAVGTVEEKPHRFGEESRFRLKFAPYGPDALQSEVFILDGERSAVSLRGEAGIGWDGWLSVPDDARYFPIDS